MIRVDSVAVEVLARAAIRRFRSVPGERTEAGRGLLLLALQGGTAL